MDLQNDTNIALSIWYSLASHAAAYERVREWHNAALLWKEAAQHATIPMNIQWANSRGELCSLRANKQPKYNK